eukprot:4921869-Pyramimonas_sp.AAC.1
MKLTAGRAIALSGARIPGNDRHISRPRLPKSRQYNHRTAASPSTTSSTRLQVLRIVEDETLPTIIPSSSEEDEARLQSSAAASTREEQLEEGEQSFDWADWRAGYASQPNEHDYWIDEIEGEIPHGLVGTYFRNGPGPSSTRIPYFASVGTTKPPHLI